MLNASFIWSCIGMTTECIFTAVTDAYENETQQSTLRGCSYMWMLPLYACLPFGLECVHLQRWHFITKCSCAALLCTTAEFLYGMLLRCIIVCPWEASYRLNSRLHVYGLVRVDWLHLWFMYGMYMLIVWRIQRVMFGDFERRSTHAVNSQISDTTVRPA